LEFLRHVERCTALVHVLDCATLEPGRDPISDLDVILAELAAYPVADGQVPLVERPQLVALNKIDVPDAKDLAGLVGPELEARGFRVFEISTVAHRGLRELTFALAAIVAQQRVAASAAPAAARIVIRPKGAEQEYSVRVEGGTYGNVYRILGDKPVRWVQQTDFRNDEAVGYLADRLQKLGVEDELFRAGATPGATVVIGEGDGVVFDWDPALSSAAELITSPRGTDARLDPNSRRTTAQRREQYHDLMDAKAAARAELDAERRAAGWDLDDEGDDA
ncbi:MAG: Obg family GTPase CgtA, partial [Microbacterium sp.]